MTEQRNVAGPWRSVQSMLQAAHESSRTTILEAIERRKKLGVQLEDDRLDWRADALGAASAVEALVDVRNREAAMDACDRLRAILSGGLRDPGPYKPDPALDGFALRIFALTKGSVLRMQAALMRVEKGSKPGDATVAEATRIEVARDFLRHALGGVRADLEFQPIDVEIPSGGEDRNGLIDALLDDLDAAGLLPAAFTCAREYQDLPPLLRRGFGLPRPSTSTTSDAASVIRPVDQPSAALAAPPPATDAASRGGPTDVPNVTSSTTMPKAATSGAPLNSDVSSVIARALGPST